MVCKHERLHDAPVRVELATRVVGQKSEGRHVNVPGPLDVLRGVHDLLSISDMQISTRETEAAFMRSPQRQRRF